MAFTSRFGLAALLLAVMLWFGLTSSAAQTPDELTPAKLEAFVTAAISADRVMAEWAPRIYGAENDLEALRLREQAGVAMGTTIEETEGITLDEYRSIYAAAQDDSKLAERLIALYQERSRP